MLSEKQKNVCLLLGSIGLLALAAVIWSVPSSSSPDANAGDTNLRDPAKAVSPTAAHQGSERMTPLASIPWKRDSDTFVAVYVGCAQLPWPHRVDEPDARASSSADFSHPAVAGLESAELPWDLQRIAAYTPVFLPTGRTALATLGDQPEPRVR